MISKPSIGGLRCCRFIVVLRIVLPPVQCWLLFVVSGCVVVALAVAGIIVGVPRNLSRAVPGSLPQRRLNAIKKPLTVKYYTHVFDYFYVAGMS